MEINKFINTYYDIVFKSETVDVSDLGKVDEFLLHDNHGVVGYSAVNSLFINTFSRKQDAVLVEATPSMKLINRDDAVQSIWLNTQASILGWDAGTAKDLLGPLFQDAGDLERKVQITVRNLLDPSFSQQHEELKKELVELLEKAIALTSLVMKQQNELVENIINSALKRSHFMMNSLTSAKTECSRTFLIAGSDHLPDNSKPPEKDPWLSLVTFNEYLKKRNAVVLSAKHANLDSIAKRRLEVWNEAFNETSEGKKRLLAFRGRS